MLIQNINRKTIAIIGVHCWWSLCLCGCARFGLLVFSCVYVSVSVCVPVFVFVCVCMCMCVHLCVCVCVIVCVCVSESKSKTVSKILQL